MRWRVFTQLARLPRPVLRLSEATSGELARSARHRGIDAPAGYGAELRAMFRARDASWGKGLWIRAGGEADFSDAEVDFVAGVGEHIAHGLRTAVLISACRDEVVLPEGPGMVVVRDDNGLESLTGQAERWLEEFPPEGLELPSVVCQVAREARVLADTADRVLRLGRGCGSPLVAGCWCTAHAFTHRGEPRQTAVMLEPARRVDLAPVIAEMYELARRERQVTQLLVSGKPIGEIAQSLCISKHTLRGHVKAIFAKMGVTSRPELTAMLFHEHYFPGIQQRHGTGQDQGAQEEPTTVEPTLIVAVPCPGRDSDQNHALHTVRLAAEMPIPTTLRRGGGH